MPLALLAPGEARETGLSGVIELLQGVKETRRCLSRRPFPILPTMNFQDTASVFVPEWMSLERLAIITMDRRRLTLAPCCCFGRKSLELWRVPALDVEGMFFPNVVLEEDGCSRLGWREILPHRKHTFFIDSSTDLEYLDLGPSA